MYDQTKLAAVEREFAEQDKKWGAPRFFVLGAVTLLIAVGLIFLASAKIMGCEIQITP
jgi:hypothetical protein